MVYGFAFYLHSGISICVCSVGIIRTHKFQFNDKKCQVNFSQSQIHTSEIFLSKDLLCRKLLCDGDYLHRLLVNYELVISALLFMSAFVNKLILLTVIV